MDHVLYSSYHTENVADVLRSALAVFSRNALYKSTFYLLTFFYLLVRILWPFDHSKMTGLGR